MHAATIQERPLLARVRQVLKACTIRCWRDVVCIHAVSPAYASILLKVSQRKVKVSFDLEITCSFKKPGNMEQRLVGLLARTMHC